MINAVSDPIDIDLETSDSDVGQDFYEDGANRYWIRDSRGDWVHLTKDLYKMELKNRGLCPICDHEKNETLSEVDREIRTTSIERRVQYAGALAGWKRGVQTFEDTRALVVRSPKLINPLEGGDWPILREFLQTRFSTGQSDQLPYLLGWWQHLLRSLYSGRPSRGMCLAMAGEAGCGKTLLKDIIKVSTGNKEVYPYDWMIGKDTFNKELTEACIWVVDDESADTSYKGRNAFGAQIKKVCANTAMRCRGLYKDGLTLEPLRRLIICVNCEPDKLQVLPELADDINDKLIITLLAGGPFPLPMRTQTEKDAFFQAVVDELPSFIHHLLNEYRLPDEYAGERFGVAPYHNEEVVGMLFEHSIAAELDQIIQSYLFYTGETEYDGPTSGIISRLTDDNVPKSIKSAFYLKGPTSLGRFLGQLQKRFPHRYRKNRSAKTRGWTITAKDSPLAEESPV